MNEKNYFTIVVPLSPDAQKIVQGNRQPSRCGRRFGRRRRNA